MIYSKIQRRQKKRVDWKDFGQQTKLNLNWIMMKRVDIQDKTLQRKEIRLAKEAHEIQD